MKKQVLHAARITLIILALALIVPWQGLQTQTLNPPAASALHTSGDQILDGGGNMVYFRGIGRAGDLDSLSGTWGGRGDYVYSYSEKWQTDMATLASDMDQTFACYANVWHINMVRIFVPVDWWWQDNVNPAQAYGTGPNQLISYRSYIELLVQQAQKYGIYVDFCPWEVLNYYISGDANDGIPGSLGASSLNYMHSINPNEMAAWQMWWTSVVNRLGRYSNVIFEMWNEPDDGSITSNSTAATAYFNYVIQTYETIRQTGNVNLIFMQWYTTLIPGVSGLDWVPQLYNQLKTSLGSSPVNVVFTAHPYRYAPYPNLQWATTYADVKAQLDAPNMVPLTRSSTCDVPLVFNEMGVMGQASIDDSSPYSNAFAQAWGAWSQIVASNETNLTPLQRYQLELNFWSAILKNAQEMDIGVCAFFWMQAGVWPGWEALLVSDTWPSAASSPVPSQAGQIFINSYVIPASETARSAPPLI